MESAKVSKTIASILSLLSTQLRWTIRIDLAPTNGTEMTLSPSFSACFYGFQGNIFYCLRILGACALFGHMNLRIMQWSSLSDILFLLHVYSCKAYTYVMFIRSQTPVKSENPSCNEFCCITIISCVFF